MCFLLNLESLIFSYKIFKEEIANFQSISDGANFRSGRFCPCPRRLSPGPPPSGEVAQLLLFLSCLPFFTRLFFFFFCLGPFSKGRSVKKKEHLQSCQEDYHTSIRSVGSFGCVLVMM